MIIGYEMGIVNMLRFWNVEFYVYYYGGNILFYKWEIEVVFEFLYFDDIYDEGKILWLK